MPSAGDAGVFCQRPECRLDDGLEDHPVKPVPNVPRGRDVLLVAEQSFLPLRVAQLVVRVAQRLPVEPPLLLDPERAGRAEPLVERPPSLALDDDTEAIPALGVDVDARLPAAERSEL